MKTPIVQFGTSRFLQAHADLFISEALERGEAIGKITIVQTTGSSARAGRLLALAAPGGFPVVVRGLEAGCEINRSQQVTSVARALSTTTDWAEVMRIVVEEAEILISNTGDTGYRVDADSPEQTIPVSFPGKLLLLLHARYKADGRPLTMLPCELVSRNGDVLKALILSLQDERIGNPDFAIWLDTAVIWANTLVDRIVSEPIEPAGAVAEPYAIWAIEQQPGLSLPCTHPNVLPVADLTPYEKLKLHILNLGHTVLADIWMKQKRPDTETVREILAVAQIRSTLLDIYETEVIPAFAANGLGGEAKAYVAATLERFDNPFLDHRMRDIANHHADKLVRRIVDFGTWSPTIAMPKLMAIANPA